jgi:hypothetical protein
VEISSNSNNNNRIPEGAFRLTAQCLGTPEEVQRPLTTSRISAVQLNVGDGSTGTHLAVLLDSLALRCVFRVFFGRHNQRHCEALPCLYPPTRTF